MRPARLAAALRFGLLVPVFAASAGLAQSPAATATAHNEAGTKLTLSVTVTVDAIADQLVADLAASATMPTPAEAEQAVTRMIAQARSTAASAPAVAASVGDLVGAYADETKTRWIAEQRFGVAASDAAVVLDLAARLQDAGLSLDHLEWRISDARAARLRRSANDAALVALLADATDAARAMNMEVDHVLKLTLEREPLPTPRRVIPHGGVSSRAPADSSGMPPTPHAVATTATGIVLLRAPQTAQ
jgi:Protein of unknown function (DUF541)